MSPLSPHKLVIFDYSGTLSLEAPRFARSENLPSALAESGLAKLGVATSETFWGEIVGPTWTEGSRTKIGYKRVMAQRIEALGLAPGVAGAEIAASSSRFVDRYLDHSRIDPLWRPTLEKLAGHPGVFVVIATDHYAEATETMIDNLHSWNIPACKAGQEIELRVLAGKGRRPPFEQGRRASDSAVINQELPPFFIANSADIGFWKADRRFWEILKPRLSLATVRSVLIIDDFGFNEEPGDSYAKQARVKARQKEMAASLQEIFQASLEMIPFFLKTGDRVRKEAAARRIAETVRRIECFMNSGDGTKNEQK